ncbi:G-type lectin S-receptor-like serine/threonine-protein kinase SD2-5 [Cryptomeria japonica]|uniref:G-type lectin S-receptor-like serine/threonine-protein kinase SD2-5 n=1 Tax=Cryptomeria japonica TaxID=3369 RepID=UPI0027DAAC1A|nr:G-type lectin S-receptor-like serine/threonine-protein kinase SD2-5 [Cryptomeria japonica]
MACKMSWHKRLCLTTYIKGGSKIAVDWFMKKNSGIPNMFSYKDLKAATNNFSTEIGRGGFGCVYRGTLKDGTKVAVKRLHSAAGGAVDEFVAEVTALASLNHSNLVRLHGLCADNSRYLLVYEFMQNGSLHDWLFDSNRESLDWKTRHSIALQTARGLQYLHQDSNSRVLHLDIKPQNILLDENFTAKVADFGLARVLSKDQSRIVTVHVRGTPGYIAPESVLDYKITAKSDVFSYGMVLLEIVSGRRVVDKSEICEQWYLPSIALGKMKEGKLADLFDSRIGSVSAEAGKVLERMIKLGIWCAQSNSALRPSMSSVVQILEGNVELLDPPVDFEFSFGPICEEGESFKIWEKTSSMDRTQCSSSSSSCVMPAEDTRTVKFEHGRD